MSSSTLYAFIDGGYLRKIGESGGRQNCDPTHLAGTLYSKCGPVSGYSPILSRTIYFDAEPGDATPQQLAYWNAIETQPDTHLGFGWLRGKSSKRAQRQKAVDTLLAVEMLSGAYNGRYGIALLVASDADFVPIVNEVRRTGPHVIVAAVTDVPVLACSDDLRRAADRFIELPSDPNSEKFKEWFRPLKPPE